MAATDRATPVLEFLDGTVHVPECNDAFLRVRLGAAMQPTDMMDVYLHDGTALVVPGRDLVRWVDAEAER